MPPLSPKLRRPLGLCSHDGAPRFPAKAKVCPSSYIVTPTARTSARPCGNAQSPKHPGKAHNQPRPVTQMVIL